MVSYLPRQLNYKCSAAAEMGDRLATIHIGRKVGATVPLFWGIGEGRNPKQLQDTSSDVEWPVLASLINKLTSEVRDEYQSINQFIEQKDRSATYIDMHEYM